MKTVMNKKGQLSLFLILSILVLFGGIFLFSISERNQSDAVASSFSTGREAELRAFVDGCVRQATENAVYEVSLKGGYASPPPDSFQVDIGGGEQLSIPVYLNGGTVVAPSISVLQASISSETARNIKSCTSGFSSFPGIKVDEKDPQVTVEVRQNSILAMVDYPLTFRSGSATTSLSSFRAEIPSTLHDLFSSGKEITEISLENSAEICVSCLLSLQEKNGLSISIDNYGGEVLVYKLSPLEANQAVPPVYIFAHRYST
jgi:hypothetical protein